MPIDLFWSDDSRARCPARQQCSKLDIELTNREGRSPNRFGRVVARNPALFEPECRTPRQIQLANALCRYREVADVI